jgi:hypothetical protein
MRRVHLRGRRNILKRLVVHAGAANLGLLMRKLFGAGTPKALQNWFGKAFSGLSALSWLVQPLVGPEMLRWARPRFPLLPRVAATSVPAASENRHLHHTR